MNVRAYSVSQKIGVCRKGFKVFKTTFFKDLDMNLDIKLATYESKLL